MAPVAVFAAPGDILFSDDFNRTALAPWTTTDATLSGILTGGPTSNSNPRAAYTSGGAVTVTGPTFNAAVPAARLDIWVRRGSNQISDAPEANEDFVVEYRRADNTWNSLLTYLGSGTAGQEYVGSVALPADALHGTLAIRVRQTGGSGAGSDYWHFDDVAVTELALSTPLVVGACEYFESGLASNWTVTAGTGFAGTSNATALSPVNSMFLNGGTVTVTSVVVDTSDPTFTDLTYWVRRGRDTFSEDPDNGNDLVVEYLNDVGSWVALETFTGIGGPGQGYSRTVSLPPEGRHAGFQLRFRQTSGKGPATDYWHVDDVCFVQAVIPVLQVSKVQQLLSDPVNGSASPYAIPGAIVQYSVSVTNQGIGAVDADSLVVTDPLPVGVALYVDTGAGDPITFSDGGTPSGLSYNYATDVTFSNQAGGGPPFDYVPTPDVDGFDPAVTGYRIAPTGTMNPSVNGSNPSFTVTLRVRIE